MNKSLLGLVAVVVLLSILVVGLPFASAQTATAEATSQPVGTASPIATGTVTSTGTATSTLTMTLPQQPYLPLEVAVKAANAALAACRAAGYKVAVSVVDSEGVQTVLVRDDGASATTPSGSFKKAFTSASVGLSTQMLVNMVKSDPTLAAVPELDDRMAFVGGGLPIIVNNRVVGGIGVAGVPAGPLNETCAKAGIDSLR
jgi:uncharacterized protein GlcG (DUF336 family)